MSLEATTAKIREKVGEDCGMGAKLKFDLGDDGTILIDAAQVPNDVTNDDAEADCTVKMSLDDLDAMLGGSLDPMVAFSMGKLQLEGDMSVAMKLGNLMQ